MVLTGVFWLPGNRFLVQRDRPETLPDGTERTVSQSAVIADDTLGAVSAYALDKAGAILYARHRQWAPVAMGRKRGTCRASWTA